MRPRTAIIILAIMAVAICLFFAYLVNIMEPVNTSNNLVYPNQKDNVNTEKTIKEKTEESGVQEKLKQEVSNLIERDLADDNKIEKDTRQAVIDMTTEVIKQREEEMTAEEIKAQEQKQDDRQKAIDEAMERIRESQ